MSTSSEPRRTEQAQSVAILGGGIAGLVAARELALDGYRVTVFEAHSEPGGRIRRTAIAGTPLDIGAEAFAVRGDAVMDLLRDLGLADRVVAPATHGSWLVRGSSAAPAPPAGAFGIPVRALDRRTVAVLGARGALRAAIEPLLPRRVGAGAGSLAGLVRARLGKRVLDRLVAPVVLGVQSSDPELTPVPQTLARRRHRSLLRTAREIRAAQPAGSAIAGLQGGMGELIERLLVELADLGITIRTSGEVASADTADGRTRITLADGSAHDDFNAVVIASAEVATALIPEHPVAGLPRTEVEVVALLISDHRLDAAPRGTGALVSPDPADPAAAKALTHVSAKWPHRFVASDGTHAIRLSYGSAGRRPATLDLDDERLRVRALADASRILGVGLRDDSLRGMERVTWRFAPAPSRPESDTRVAGRPHWRLVGDWVAGTGLASVIPAARAVAQELAQTLTAEQLSATAPEKGRA